MCCAQLGCTSPLNSSTGSGRRGAAKSHDGGDKSCLFFWLGVGGSLCTLLPLSSRAIVVDEYVDVCGPACTLRSRTEFTLTNQQGSSRNKPLLPRDRCMYVVALSRPWYYIASTPTLGVHLACLLKTEVLDFRSIAHRVRISLQHAHERRYGYERERHPNDIATSAHTNTVVVPKSLCVLFY